MEGGAGLVEGRLLILLDIPSPRVLAGRRPGRDERALSRTGDDVGWRLQRCGSHGRVDGGLRLGEKGVADDGRWQWCGVDCRAAFATVGTRGWLIERRLDGVGWAWILLRMPARLSLFSSFVLSMVPPF